MSISVFCSSLSTSSHGTLIFSGSCCPGLCSSSWEAFSFFSEGSSSREKGERSFPLSTSRRPADEVEIYLLRPAPGRAPRRNHRLSAVLGGHGRKNPIADGPGGPERYLQGGLCQPSVRYF